MQSRLSLSDLKAQLKDKEALEKSIEKMKQEQTDAHAELKVKYWYLHLYDDWRPFLCQGTDSKIAAAQEPIDRIQRERQEAEREWSSKLSQAQRLSQELNISVDKLENMNKQVEK